MQDSIHINGARLMQRFADMAGVGATPKGGVRRVALTDEDRSGRDLFVQWCRDAGCQVTVDQVGNIFARRPGSKPGLEPVLTGSHLDSQPTGGRFDGVYGVLAGLEVIQTLNDLGISTDHPLEVVSWTNEEGARFAPGLTGSGVFTGTFELEEALASRDKDGRTFGEELRRIGYAGENPSGGRSIKAYFEAHIEQGPLLEAKDKMIGVVQGVQGLRWYDLVLEGQEAHAGTTPMESRHDPVAGAVNVLRGIFAENEVLAPHGRATFGQIIVEPGSRNTVPGRVTVTLDFRHPDAGVIEAMHAHIEAIMEVECRALGLRGRVEQVASMPPVSFDPGCIQAIRRAADSLGLTSMDMISGAGHDAQLLAGVAPTGMIFVPCEKGISHNEKEYARPQDLVAGADVLLQVIQEFARAGV